MANKTLTGSNAAFILAVRNLFNPIALQGFGVDDVYSAEGVASSEVLMGVDGNMSAGFVFVPFKQTVTLQGDSDSNDLFDDWHAANITNQDVFFADATIILKAIGKTYTLTKGALTLWAPAPDVKKLIQPRKFEITWQGFSPANS